MKSQIIITVEHGDGDNADTDSITEFVETISANRGEDGQWLQAFGFDFTVVDTEVKVDVQDWCKECGGRNGSHFPACTSS